MDSFMRRSMILPMSMMATLLRELARVGAAYWADASQMKMLRPATSARRLRKKVHRMCEVRGYTGW